MKCTGLLLAGGKSSRMGQDKALLPIGGRPAIVRIAEVLGRVSEEVIIASGTGNAYRELDLKTASDRFPGAGPLAGLHAGLLEASSSVCCTAACDLPFIDSGVYMDMLRLLKGYDAVVPKIDGRLQPLYAVYKTSCLAALEDCLTEGNLRMRGFLDKINVYIATETDFSLYREDPEQFSRLFFNMNRPEDYEKAKQEKEHDDEL